MGTGLPVNSRPMKSSKLLISLGAAVIIGVALRFVVGLEPIWWLAWFVPGLMLALALRTEGWTSRGLVALAAVIGVSVDAPYFLSVMWPAPAILVMALLS